MKGERGARIDRQLHEKPSNVSILAAVLCPSTHPGLLITSARNMLLSKLPSVHIVEEPSTNKDSITTINIAK